MLKKVDDFLNIFRPLSHYVDKELKEKYGKYTQIINIIK